MPVADVAAIEVQADGPERRVTVTGSAGHLAVRYTSRDEPLVTGLIGRLRQRAAGDPMPVPPGQQRTGILAGGWRPGRPALCGLDAADAAAAVMVRSRRLGRGLCLAAMTPREFIAVRAGRGIWWWRCHVTTLYIPRRRIDAASLSSGSLLLRSSGVNLNVRLGGRKAGAAVSRWFGHPSSDHDHSGTGG